MKTSDNKLHFIQHEFVLFQSHFSRSLFVNVVFRIHIRTFHNNYLPIFLLAKQKIVVNTYVLFYIVILIGRLWTENNRMYAT